MQVFPQILKGMHWESVSAEVATGGLGLRAPSICTQLLHGIKWDKIHYATDFLFDFNRTLVLLVHLCSRCLCNAPRHTYGLRKRLHRTETPATLHRM